MYLVTGGAGFIGSHLVHRLVTMGKRVRVLDNFSAGKNNNLSGLEERVEIIQGDLVEQKAVRKAMEGVEVVFHEGALRSVPFSVENPSLVNSVNVQGTLNVLIAARHAGARRVVYASSSSVYGNKSSLPTSESELPSPLSPYAASKLAGEHYCKVFSEIYGLETVSLRYFNVYGPRQDPDSQYAAVIPRFIRRAIQGEPLEVHGDGLQSRDFTYIDNVVAVNLLAGEVREANGRVFNVGQGKANSLLDLIDLLRRILGKEIKWFHSERRAGDIRHTMAGISQAKHGLGYRPQVGFEKGIAKTVEYFQRDAEARISREAPEIYERLAARGHAHQNSYR